MKFPRARNLIMTLRRGRFVWIDESVHKTSPPPAAPSPLHRVINLPALNAQSNPLKYHFQRRCIFSHTQRERGRQGECGEGLRNFLAAQERGQGVKLEFCERTRRTNRRRDIIYRYEANTRSRDTERSSSRPIFYAGIARARGEPGENRRPQPAGPIFTSAGHLQNEQQLCRIADCDSIREIRGTDSHRIRISRKKWSHQKERTKPQKRATAETDTSSSFICQTARALKVPGF